MLFLTYLTFTCSFCMLTAAAAASHWTVWCLADQNECVLAPSEPTEFSLYVHNLQNVERRGSEGCSHLSARPPPSRQSHHRSQTSRVQHTTCAIFPHINKTYCCRNLTPCPDGMERSWCRGSVCPGTSALHLCVFLVFIALNLLNRYCTSRRLEARAHTSDIQCWYVRRPTSSSLIWFFFKRHPLIQFHFYFSLSFFF